MDSRPRHNAKGTTSSSSLGVDFPTSADNSSCPASGSSMDAVLGPVPSQLEVESAITSLQDFMRQMSELKQHKEQRGGGGGASSKSNGHTRVREAFHLLQSDPAIQKLVAALATDEAVWDAVKNNEMVHKLREPSRSPGASFRLPNCKDEEASESDEATHLVRWIMDIASRIIELFQKWHALMHVVSHPWETRSHDGRPPQTADELQQQMLMDQRIGPPLLLAVVTLLIVVVARAQGPHFW